MEHTYYINLSHRTDRKIKFEKQMSNFDISCTRIDAIFNASGSIGCGLSHIKALTNASTNNSDYSIICEDDLFIFDNQRFIDFNASFEKIKTNNSWQVIVLTPRGTTIAGSDEMNLAGFKRIHENQTATGYIIKNSFIPILINNLKEAIIGLMNGLDPNIYAIDQYWKKLQDEHYFYYYNSIFAGQLPGYSDIERKPVNYNKRFVDQIHF